MSPRNVVLSEKQFEVVEAALALYSRVQIGQLEYIAEALVGHRCCDKPYTAKYEVLCRAKFDIFDLPVSANLGISNPDVPETARVAWDLRVVMTRHRTGAVLGATSQAPLSREPVPAITPGVIASPASTFLDDLNRVFAVSAGRALFVRQWADYVENTLGRGLQGEIMTQAPPTPQYFVEAGWRLLGAIENANAPCSLVNIMVKAAKADGKDDMAYWTSGYVGEFAHYAAMQSMGEGVSWFDNHSRFDIKIPHREAPDLDSDEFPEPERDGE